MDAIDLYISKLSKELVAAQRKYQTLGTEIIIQPYLRIVSYRIYVKRDSDREIVVDISSTMLQRYSTSDFEVKIFDGLRAHARRLGR